MKNKKIGILVVSFGTSYADTCKKTITVIEQEIQEAYPDVSVYRAWMSEKIRKKVERRDGVHIYDVTEALEVMAQNGIRTVIVQSTHILDGAEQNRMKKILEDQYDRFESIFVGDPLLAKWVDCEQAADVILESWQIRSDEMLLFMGHGRMEESEQKDSFSGQEYAAVNEILKKRGCQNRRIAALEGIPAMEAVLLELGEWKPKKILLSPFMIVAGEHARKQMAGEQETSWKQSLERAGYQTECRLIGLGEYPGIRNLILQHLKQKIETADIDRIKNAEL